MKPYSHHIGIAAYIWFACLLFSGVAQAQQIDVPFVCNFEDMVEWNNWTLNKGTAQAADQWTIGTATHVDGNYSLYITADNSTARYGCSPDIVLAYRTIRFPQGKGAYNISFDWRCVGDTANARLYVYIGPEQHLTTGLYSDGRHNYGLLDIVSETSGMLSAKVIDKFAKLSDGTTRYDCLYGSKKWQNCFVCGDSANPEFSISLNNTNSRMNWILAFLWVNANTKDSCCYLGACVDNIQIASANVKKPANLQAEMSCEDSTLRISWQSTALLHDIEYRNVNENTWKRITNIPATDSTIQTYRLSMRQEGNFNLRIRGYMSVGGEPSAYSTLNNIVYWCPDNHCINYIDLHAENTVCRYGDWGTAPTPVPDQIGVIDFGEEERESRHTVNWIEDRFDPLTKGSIDANGQPVDPLYTIPDGYPASVRLGNWENGSGCESITYDFVVDSVSQAILILKYAIVFQNPAHSGKQCMFRIEVLDSIGRTIDPTCGKAEFVFDDAAKWNYVPHEQEDQEIYWKDWTTLGIDLRKYHGMTLRVCVTNADCGQGGHFGYSYFVLDCVSASIDTDNCGDDSTVELNAPDGFTYTWTDSKGKVIGTQRTIRADAGYETYTCEACMKDAPDCCFFLTTDFAPRYPYPQYAWKQVPQQCRNYVQLFNQSHVLTKYADKEVHTAEACEHITWELATRDGVTSTTTENNPVIECDASGDTIYVRLQAVLGGGKCEDSLSDTVCVPPVLTPDSTIIANLCAGDTYIFAQQGCDTTGIYYDYQKNWAGCDSVTVLDLRVHPKSPATCLSDTVCSVDLPYVFNGISYLTTGIYEQMLFNRWNCDSLVQLSLQVVEKLVVTPDSLPTLCADNGQLLIDYSVMQGRFDSLAVRFKSASPQPAFYDSVIYDNRCTQVVYPFEVDILPGRYTVELEFYQHHTCNNQVFERTFDIYYRASVIEQKWNNVLALLNAEYNGGYTFTAYQWYKNDIPIAGETGPYLYQDLDTTAEYSVQLTREDGVAVRTCAFRPTWHTDKYEFPTLVQAGQRLSVRRTTVGNNMCQVKIYTLLGVCCLSACLENGEGIVIAPAYAGNYIVECLYEDGQTVTGRLLVTP